MRTGASSRNESSRPSENSRRATPSSASCSMPWTLATVGPAGERTHRPPRPGCSRRSDGWPSRWAREPPEKSGEQDEREVGDEIHTIRSVYAGWRGGNPRWTGRARPAFASDTSPVRRPIRGSMKRMLALALSGSVMLALFLILVWAGQRRMIYFPAAEVPLPAAVGLANVEAITFATEDGVTLHGWFLPGARSPARFTVIVFNGNAGNRAYRALLGDALRANGCSVLLFDYRGFGGECRHTDRGGAWRRTPARRARTHRTARRRPGPPGLFRGIAGNRGRHQAGSRTRAGGARSALAVRVAGGPGAVSLSAAAGQAGCCATVSINRSHPTGPIALARHRRLPGRIIPLEQSAAPLRGGTLPRRRSLSSRTPTTTTTSCSPVNR